MDFSIENSDFPVCYLKLPEGNGDLLDKFMTFGPSNMMGRRGGLPEAERHLVELAIVHHHVLWMVKLQNSEKVRFVVVATAF